MRYNMNRFQICVVKQNFAELQHTITVIVEEMDSDSWTDAVDENLIIFNTLINKKNFFYTNSSLDIQHQNTAI